jgi:hypothetical protein
MRVYSRSKASFPAQQLSNPYPKLRRRSLLQAALSVASLLAGRSAGALRQMSQAEAEYQDQPKNGFGCAACTLFRSPRSCRVVAGDISPNGWCKFFDLPD